MNSLPPTEGRTATLPAPEAGYFGPATRPLFGWLHRPRVTGDLGIVIVNPFGYEAICAHRSLRHFALAAAKRGVATLRFDLDGTGDSSGDDLDADRVGAWIASIGHAVYHLRARTGASRIALLGTRLGATLATLAGAERGDLESIAMIAPITSGRAYVRELKLLQASLGLAPPPAGTPETDGVEEALGFAITAETKAALGKIDLGRIDRAPAKRVLVLDREDLAPSDALVTQLRSLGVEVEQHSMRGYLEMVADPHKAVVPEAMLGVFGRWLGDAAPCDGPSSLVPTVTAADVSTGVLETAMQLGERRVFGILTESAERVPRPRVGVILLNAGAVHHVGPNRMYVELARRLARRGHLVLRMDVTGLGDTHLSPGDVENDVYTPHAVADVRCAVQTLRARGVTVVHAGGICSGAYQSFRAAAEGARLDGIFPVNPATFAWKKGMTLDVTRQPYTESVVEGEAARYSASALSTEKWKKLLRGDVNVRALAEILGRHALARSRDGAVEVLRHIGVHLPGDLGAELAEIARRGVRAHFVFATGESGLSLLASRGGSTFRGLLERGALELSSIEGPDHTFTARWAQERLASHLEEHFAGV